MSGPSKQPTNRLANYIVETKPLEKESLGTDYYSGLRTPSITVAPNAGENLTSEEFDELLQAVSWADPPCGVALDDGKTPVEDDLLVVFKTTIEPIVQSGLWRAEYPEFVTSLLERWESLLPKTPIQAFKVSVTKT